MDIITKIKNKENFTYKFGDNPFGAGGRLRDGWAEPTFDDFLTRMVREPVFLNQSTVIPMTSLQHDLDMFDQEIDFETQRPPQMSSFGYGEIGEVPFDPLRKQLLAQPLALRSNITQNFLDENVEKDGFLSTWTSYLAAQAGPAMERFGIFSKKVDHTAEEWKQPQYKSAFNVTDGLLQQLISRFLELGGAGTATKGIGKLVYGNEVPDGIFRNIHRYVGNNGDLDNATLVLPPQIYSRFMAETANDRDTELGDIVWADGKTPKVMGIEIKNDHVLRKSPNGFDVMKFSKPQKSGAGSEYNISGVKYTDLLFGFLSKPSNNVFGIMRDTEVKQEYSIDVLGYKTALLAKADAKYLFDEDTLAIPFTLTSKPDEE